MANHGNFIILILLCNACISLPSESRTQQGTHKQLNADSTEFTQYLNDLYTACCKGDTNLIVQFISKNVCISAPDVFIESKDSINRYKSGKYDISQSVKLLIKGIDKARLIRLLNKLNWDIEGNNIIVYEQFYCSDCPDEVFSYYWVFGKTNQKIKYRLIKIYNNDYDITCK